MTRRLHTLVVLLGAAAALTGCESAKSSNPTSPSVAGPIPGVAITTPKPLEPGANWTISSPNQPITLLIENSSTNGVRPVSYVFEVSLDADFANKVFAREGVEPGSGGRTSLRLPDALASDRVYFWRAKAADGANASSYSPPVSFSVVTPAVLETPVPLAPVGGIRVTSRRPDFVVRNSARSGPISGVSYVFEISENDSFTAPLAIVTLHEGALETRFTLAQELAYERSYFWRVRSFDPGTSSPWTATQTFLTPVEPPPPPPPPTTPTPTPPPSGLWPRNGQELVAWAEANYPDRLVAGVSLSERQSNMAFVRDRMIEGGICGGMTLAWNLKRGGPERSIDFLAYKKNGVWIGVDIGLAYDDTSIPLRLQWGETGPDLIFPQTYSPWPSCK